MNTQRKLVSIFTGRTWIALLLMILAFGQQISAQTFIHPGGLHTQADLDRMKAKVAAGAHPWIDDWNKLIADSQASLTYGTHVQANMGTSRQNADLDAHAAYLDAIRWYISGNTAYAEKAVSILNAWSAAVNQVPTGTDIPGLIGIPITNFALAAEVLRTYSGWAASDFARFQSMMTTYLYPVCHDFLTNHNGAGLTNYWANWDACNIGAMIAMGVLCDRADIFNEGVTYFKSGGGTGSIMNAVYYLHTPTLGQWQESGRDQEHAQLGIGLLGAACQVAWNQGVDLFGYSNNRLLAGAEYVAQTNLSQPVPYVYYTNEDNANQSWVSRNFIGRLDDRPVWELIYNHYAVRQGLSTPNSKAMAQLMRPEPGAAKDHFGYGTLTFTLDAAASPYPPLPAPAAPTGLTATASVSQVALDWNPSPTNAAQGYRVLRSTTDGGPYTSIASWTDSTYPHYVDATVTNGVTYYYVVTAINQTGESANSAQATTTALAASTALPPGWTNQDVGTASTSGSATFASVGDGTFIAQGTGGGINGASDSGYNYTYKTVTGDFILTTRLWNVDWNSGGGIAGLMMRESLNANSAAILMTLGDSGGRQAKAAIRASTGANLNRWNGNDYSIVPAWFRLKRSGNTFTAYESPDGVTWFIVKTATISMAATYYAGLVLANGSSTLNAVTFDHVAYTGLDSPVPTPWAHADVGSTGIAGAATYTNERKFNVSGAGSLFGASVGSFHFAYCSSLSSSHTVTARISAPPTVAGAQFGLMIRRNTPTNTDDNRMGALVIEASGSKYQARLARVLVGSSTAITWSSAVTNLDLPQWLRLTRSGQTYKAEVSANGSTWTTVGTGTISHPLTNTFYIGPFTCSGDTSLLNAAKFESVSVSDASSALWTPPAAPTSLSATLSGANASLTWSAVSNATSYSVERASVSGGPYTVLATSVTSTAYSDPITSGPWYYIVRAMSASGASAPSNESAGVTALPAMPEGLTAANGNGSVALSWNAVSGATSYTVKRSNTSGGPYTAVNGGSGLAVTTFTDAGLTNGNTYYYVVVATNSAGSGPISTQVSATPLSPPVAPTGLSATAGNQSVFLNWTASATAVSYNVKRSTVSGSGYAVVAASVTGTSYTDTGRTNGATYFYVVSAVNSAGESGNSSQASAMPVDPPSAPASLNAAPGFASATLTWPAVSGATSYNVKRSQTSGAGYTTAQNVAALTYQDGGLTPGATYYYVVTALNNLVESANSPQASATATTSARWNNSASGAQNWTVIGNWLSAGAYPSASGVTAAVNTDIPGDQTINLNTTVTLASLSVGDANATNAFTIVAGGGSFALQNGGSAASLTQLSTSKGDTISAPISLAENLSVTNNSSANPLTISGAIGESAASKTVTLSGSVVMAGANTYTGLTTISAGATKAGRSTLGASSGPFGGQNNALTVASGAALDLNGYNVGVGTFASSGAITNSAGGAPAVLTIGNNNSRITGWTNGVLTGNLAVVLTGNNSTADNSAASNTHTGGTIFSGNNVNDRITNTTAFGSGAVTFGGANGGGGFFVPSTVTGFTAWASNIAVAGSGNVFTYDAATTSSGTWTGDGTLSISNQHTAALTLSGNLTGFQGRFLLLGGNGFVNLSNTSAVGAAQAQFTMRSSGASSTTLQSSGGGSRTVPLGDLNTEGNTGSGTITLRNNTASTTATFEVGALGLNSTYDGIVTNGATPGTMITALKKTGVGAWTLTGTNTYTGPTTISNGTLAVNGSLAAASAVAVNNNAALAGTGIIGGSVTVGGGGAISPGNGVGPLTTGAQTWNGGGRLNVELSNPDDAAGSGWDLLTINGALAFDASLTSTVPFQVKLTGLTSGGIPGQVSGFDNRRSYSWRIVSAASISGAFSTNQFLVDASDFIASNPIDGGQFAVAQSGNALVLTFTPSDFAAWKLSKGIAASVSETADPDGNGVPLVTEYAFGINPGAALGTGSGGVAKSGSNAQFTFNRARSDLFYDVLVSTNLIDWSLLATNPGTVGGLVTVSYTPPAPGTRCFFRLQIRRQ